MLSRAQSACHSYIDLMRLVSLTSTKFEGGGSVGPGLLKGGPKIGPIQSPPRSLPQISILVWDLVQTKNLANS